MPIVLVVSNRVDPTADLVEAELAAMSASFFRLNTDRLGIDFDVDFRLTSGAAEVLFDTPTGAIHGRDVISIWNRRPLPPVASAIVVGSEARLFAAAELKATLDGALLALDRPWVSPPQAIRAANHKVFQLQLASDLGFCTPETLVSNSSDRVRAFVSRLEREGKRAVVKVVSPGPPQAPTLDEQYCLFTTLVSSSDLEDDSQIAGCPAMYQEYVEKEYELRVTVVGSRVFACEIHSQVTARTVIDWRRYDLPNTPHRVHYIDRGLSDRCVQLTKRAGLRFSAIDLVVRPDRTVAFLEMNPNGQWGWIEELTGLPIARGIAELLLNPSSG